MKLVLLVLPAAGSLTARESGEDSLAPTQNGGEWQLGARCKINAK